MARHQFDGSDLRCIGCDGSGKTVLFVGRGSEFEDMPCLECVATGRVSAAKKLQQAIRNNVWCKCDIRQRYRSERITRRVEDIIYAPDGRRVFGNDTYLCLRCGMVAQFG